MRGARHPRRARLHCVAGAAHIMNPGETCNELAAQRMRLQLLPPRNCTTLFLELPWSRTPALLHLAVEPNANTHSADRCACMTSKCIKFTPLAARYSCKAPPERGGHHALNGRGRSPSLTRQGRAHARPMSAMCPSGRTSGLTNTTTTKCAIKLLLLLRNAAKPPTSKRRPTHRPTDPSARATRAQPLRVGSRPQRCGAR